MIFKVKEKERQGIYGTGGTGGVGGAYLGLIYTTLNLMGIGEVLTVKLDGGAAQSTVLVDPLTRHFWLPFTLALRPPSVTNNTSPDRSGPRTSLTVRAPFGLVGVAELSF